jgi:hypothetical protein
LQTGGSEGVERDAIQAQRGSPAVPSIPLFSSSLPSFFPQKHSVLACDGGHRVGCLTAEAVEGLALALEGVDDVEGRHGLAASVLSVGHGVADDVLEEDLEDTAGLLVDEAGDALHTTTTSEAADGGLLQVEKGRRGKGGRGE